VLTAGAMLVFFGHVENYAWASAATVAALLLAARAAEGAAGPLGAGAAAGLAVAFHPIAVFPLAPALLGTALAVRRPAFATRLLAGAAAAPLLLVVACAAAGIAPPSLGFNRFGGDPAVLLSPAQALAPANLARVLDRAVLLLSPGVFLALLAALAAPRPPSRGAVPLLAAAAGGVVCFAWFHGKIRPEAQDWDLWAAAALPIALAAGRALRGPDAATTRAWATGVSAAVLLLGVLGHRTP
jgi:hypothetical protein